MTDPGASIHEDLERSRARFHALLESLSAEEWDAPSRNPAWTNGQVIYHILFAFMLVPSLFWMIKFWSRLPWGASRAFAAVLDFSTPLFNWVNALGPRGQARVLGRKRAEPIFERVHRSTLRKVDSLHGSEWQRGMHYPTRWDPSFGDFMTFEDLLRYPSKHMERHLRQLSAGSAEDE
ncbi:MAG: DinB family protein [Coriobacteriales bacterium]|nr:DinB family protein [Coriobacteriales bacterium]